MEGSAYIEIRVGGGSAAGTYTVEYRPSEEQGWASDRSGPPHEELPARVWDALGSDRRAEGNAEALRLGRELGGWLLDGKAAASLKEHRRSGKGHLRIELCLPEELQGYPWEIAALEDGLPLGVDESFTVVRKHSEASRHVWQPIPRLDVLLVGVQYGERANHQPVLSLHELEGVRNAMGGDAAAAFNVEVDPLGSWKALVNLYEQREPPHIFHFAGHGLSGGRGLVFRSGDGGAEEVDVGRLVSLLASRGGRGRAQPGPGTQLVFLNACYSASSNRARHPLGGTARALHEHGVPAVVGCLSPIGDCDAEPLARHFYSRLAAGDSIDVALQGARRSLYQTGSRAWPFVALSVCGLPGALVGKAQDSGSPVAPAGFGFDAQHNRIRVLVQSQRPAVVVVHGELRMGHRQCLARIQQELERSGKALWRPVAAFQYYGGREALLQRSQLCGAMAVALGVSDSGSMDELEQRVADQMAQKTRDRVLLIEIVHVITPETEADAQAVFTLVGELWTTLVQLAQQRSKTVPAVLLVPIAYPKRRRWFGRGSARHTRRLISTLAEARERQDGLIEVLPELEAFRRKELEDFLHIAAGASREQARRLAAEALRAGDNEAILERMEETMKRWAQS